VTKAFTVDLIHNTGTLYEDGGDEALTYQRHKDFVLRTLPGVRKVSAITIKGVN
jgi:hypothetical protein